jgi:hypothetical protein
MDLSEATADAILDKFLEDHPECVQHVLDQPPPYLASSISPSSRSPEELSAADQWSGHTELYASTVSYASTSPYMGTVGLVTRYDTPHRAHEGAVSTVSSYFVGQDMPLANSIVSGDSLPMRREPVLSRNVQTVGSMNTGSYPPGLETPWRANDIRNENVRAQTSGQNQWSQADRSISPGGDTRSPRSFGNEVVSGQEFNGGLSTSIRPPTGA